jgi:hypothetical protein
VRSGAGGNAAALVTIMALAMMVGWRLMMMLMLMMMMMMMVMVMTMMVTERTVLVLSNGGVDDWDGGGVGETGDGKYRNAKKTFKGLH